jgi:hypothetical protein
MTISLRLDRWQRRRMTRFLRKTRSRIEALRAPVLLLLDEGVIPSVVAEMAGCATIAAVVGHPSASGLQIAVYPSYPPRVERGREPWAAAAAPGAPTFRPLPSGG